MVKLKELREKGRVYGLKCGEFVGKLDQTTLSLKTAQCSLFEDSSKSFSTFPKSGICVSGNVFTLRNLDSIIRENDSLVLPTPSKSDAFIILQSLESYQKYYRNGHQDKTTYQCQLNGLTASQTLNLYEWMMGFPLNWTKEE